MPAWWTAHLRRPATSSSTDGDGHRQPATRIGSRQARRRSSHATSPTRSRVRRLRRRLRRPAASSAPPLRVPIDGAAVDTFKGGFAEHRGSRRTRPWTSSRRAARRSTRSSNGTIAKLFLSKPGGTTIYEFDSSGRCASTTRISIATRTVARGSDGRARARSSALSALPATRRRTHRTCTSRCSS